MDPVTTATALKALSTAFSLGLDACKVREKWGLNSEELSAIQSLLASASTVATAVSGGTASSPELEARHVALVARAFGVAFRAHWGGSHDMTRGYEKTSWISRRFLSKAKEERIDDIESRLRLALNALSTPIEAGSNSAVFDRVSALVDNPVNSPYFAAFWRAFSNPRLDGEEQVRVLELDDEGARLEFERSFSIAYAEAIATSEGANLSQGLLALHHDRPRFLRHLVVRHLATWKSRHVFGDEVAPGLPEMPLGKIYVEPDGVYKENVNGSVTEHRKPVRQLIRALLGSHKIVVVRGDFGLGKSLTARMFACDLAEAFVTDKQAPSADLTYPVFVKCCEDFRNHKPECDLLVRRALRRHARAVGIDLPLTDDSLALPSSSERVLVLVDGLDEVALTSSESEEFFRRLDEAMGSRWRAVVLGRKGAMPPEEKLLGIPVIDLQQLQEQNVSSSVAGTAGTSGQVGEWLSRWNALSERSPISVQALSDRRLLSIATTPIILFMIAVTWESVSGTNESVTRAEIYERFFLQMAEGKCRFDPDRHSPIVEASEKLLEILDKQKELPPQQPGATRQSTLARAMLWMLARVAWEARRQADKGEELTMFDVSRILTDELNVSASPDIQELVRVGVMLVLQADNQGGNDRILFGHKSFREFLVGRYWATNLRKILKASRKEASEVERRLYGANLLDEDDQSIDFLMDLVGGPTWDANARHELVKWVSETFNDETLKFRGSNHTMREEERARLRLAALAIGSLMLNEAPIEARDCITLRSLVGSLFGSARRYSVVAPRLISPGANLEDANLEGANLKGANLKGANLKGANLEEAHLEKAQLLGANLEKAQLLGANLKRASLEKAQLFRANLEGANLAEANLAEANLAVANLARANLEDANLEGANLGRANLEWANLKGANLGRANLGRANLKGATYDQRTTFRGDFSPNTHGMVFVDEVGNPVVNAHKNP